MKINLLVDYRGVLTDEQYFEAGEYQAVPDLPLSEEQARALVDDGRAVEIKAPKMRVTRRKSVKK